MGVNKVIYYGEVLVDMSQVTVTPNTLEKGETALDASGNLITGTHECPETEPKLQAKTVTPTTSQQNVTPDSGYDGLSKVTVNAMPTATQATPSISVNSSGLITASATQSAGYVSAGTKSATKQLTTQAAKTVTPSTSNQTAVASGRYTTGTVTVKGDANLKADNIKSGVSIFGVTGSYEGSGGGGGGSETATVTIVNNSDEVLDIAGVWDDGGTFYCYDVTVFDGDTTTVTAAKNSIIIVPSYVNKSVSGSLQNTLTSNGSFVFVQGDGTITITD